LVPSPGTQQPSVLVNVPVLRGDEVAYVLSMSVPPEHWRAVLQQTVLTPAWSASLVDRGGKFIASLRGQGPFVGQAAAGDIAEGRAGQGTLMRTDADGREVLFAYRSSALAGWTVGIGVPSQLVHAPLRRSLTLLAGAGLSLLGLCVVLATLFGGRIARPMQALSVSAARLGRGDPVDPLFTGLREVNEVGRNLAAAAIGLRERAAALRLSEERYRLATEAYQGGVFDYDVASDRMDRTPRYDEIVGEAPGGPMLTKSGWHARIHPEDRPAFEAARQAIYEAGAPQYEAEYRVRHADGTWVWIWHRALAVRNERGAVRRVVGAILDITERKRAEEHLKLMVHELNHRVKNTLAIVQSIAAHTLRATVPPAEAREAFEARLLALSRAHNSLTRQNWEGATLRSIVVETVEPYRVTRGDRFQIEGPDVWVGPETAVALAMALHELATNAAKHGALTTLDGQVSVSWRVDRAAQTPSVELCWRETGGPPVTKPDRPGFGSRLIQRSLPGDPGSVRLDYDPDGVTCTFLWALEEGESSPASSDQKAPLPAAK
jgi:PAS domain S-box-containing protein